MSTQGILGIIALAVVLLLLVGIELLKGQRRSKAHQLASLQMRQDVERLARLVDAWTDGPYNEHREYMVQLAERWGISRAEAAMATGVARAYAASWRAAVEAERLDPTGEPIPPPGTPLDGGLLELEPRDDDLDPLLAARWCWQEYTQREQAGPERAWTDGFVQGCELGVAFGTHKTAAERLCPPWSAG